MAALTGSSIELTITDDNGTALGGLVLAVTGPNNYSAAITTSAAGSPNGPGRIRLTGLPIGDYTITNPATGRTGTLPVLTDTAQAQAIRDEVDSTTTAVIALAQADMTLDSRLDTVEQQAASGVTQAYADAYYAQYDSNGDLAINGSPVPDSAFPDTLARDSDVASAVTTASTADRARSNHTGVQPISSVTGLDSALAGKASLDVNGFVPDSQIAPAIARDSEVAAASVTDRARANHTGTQLVATLSDFPEAVQDLVAGTLVAGTNITVTYDDVAGTITLASTAGGGSSTLAVQDENGTAVSGVTLLDFQGAGVTATQGAAGEIIVTVPGAVGGGADGAPHTIADEGISLTQRPVLNFMGAGVTATDNAASGRTDVTVPAQQVRVQDEGAALVPYTFLNFTGAGVTASNDGAGDRVNVNVPGQTSDPTKADLDSNGFVPDVQIAPAITRDSELAAGLATKADLVGGTVPDSQIAATITRDAEYQAADSAHAAATDPHTGYQREVEKGAANGYASLDASAFVPDAQISPTIARDAEVASAVAAHEADTTNVHGIADTATVVRAVQDEGAALTATTLNFVGAGVTATAAGGVASINIPGGGSVAPVDRQAFTTSGTWTKPTAGQQFGSVIAFGAGSGASAGSVGAAGTSRAGGSGGGGGGRSVSIFLLADLPATVTVTVGAGGLGGAAVTTGAGTAGTLGGPSSFGSFVRTRAASVPGAAGQGQVAGGPAGGNSGAAGGGSTGGAISAANAATAPVAGGLADVFPGGTGGVGGVAGSTADGTVNGSPGANGGTFGAGGGGGGAATTGATSGKGGDGAGGYVEVISW